MNTASETVAKVAGTRGIPAALVGDIVLHASTRVDLGLDGIDRSAESGVKLSGIGTISISERVAVECKQDSTLCPRRFDDYSLDMFLRSIDTKPLFRHFELFRGVTMGHERQDPYLCD